MRGYHKPIMIAGGVGNIRAAHTHKQPLADGTLLIQLGGPGHAHRHGRRRGVVDGDRRQHGRSRLRFGAARQRGDRAARAGSDRPLLAARRRAIRSCRSTTSARAACRTRCPSSIHGGGVGGTIELRAIPVRRARACRRARSGATRRRSATCSRSHRSDLARFRAICERERCPFAVVGARHGGRPLAASSTIARSATTPVDVPLDVILGKPPKMTRDVTRVARALPPLDLPASRCAMPPTACCSSRRSPTRRFS